MMDVQAYDDEAKFFSLFKRYYSERKDIDDSLGVSR